MKENPKMKNEKYVVVDDGLTLDEMSNYTGISRKVLVNKYSNNSQYGNWFNGKFSFYIEQFAEGEPAADKLDEDKRREDYIKQHGKEQVEQEEAKLEINY